MHHAATASAPSRFVVEAIGIAQEVRAVSDEALEHLSPMHHICTMLTSGLCSAVGASQSQGSQGTCLASKLRVERDGMVGASRASYRLPAMAASMLQLMGNYS